MSRSRMSFVAVLSLAVVTLGSTLSAAANGKEALKLRAFTVDLNGPSRARTGNLDIVIERWSTDAELARLHDVLVEKGPDGLLSALQKMKPRAGYIRTSTSLGWDIHFARQETLSDGSRRIMVATDRPMSFWEMVNRTRSADYAFTLADIRLKPDGTGEGKLAAAAKVAWDEETKTLEIENFSQEPVRLTQVQVEKSK